MAAIRILIATALAAGALLVAGCGSGERKVRVWGEVSYGGEPVPQGEIVFTPVDGTTGPATGGAIQDGRYDVPDDAGPLAGGTYRVEIQGRRSTGETMRVSPNPDAPPVEVLEPYIPAAYSSNQSTLKVTIAADGSEEQHDFHLQTVPAGANPGR
jgi:hypothetical protein